MTNISKRYMIMQSSNNHVVLYYNIRVVKGPYQLYRFTRRFVEIGFGWNPPSDRFFAATFTSGLI
jgi:hypothetical protein